VRTAYRDAAMLVTGSDQMKQEQVTVEMEQFEDDLHKLLEVILVKCENDLLSGTV